MLLEMSVQFPKYINTSSSFWVLMSEHLARENNGNPVLNPERFATKGSKIKTSRFMSAFDAIREHCPWMSTEFCGMLFCSILMGEVKSVSDFEDLEKRFDLTAQQQNVFRDLQSPNKVLGFNTNAASDDANNASAEVSMKGMVGSNNASEDVAANRYVRDPVDDVLAIDVCKAKKGKGKAPPAKRLRKTVIQDADADKVEAGRGTSSSSTCRPNNQQGAAAEPLVTSAPSSSASSGPAASMSLASSSTLKANEPTTSKKAARSSLQKLRDSCKNSFMAACIVLGKESNNENCRIISSMLHPIRSGYTEEQTCFRKGPEATRQWYSAMASGRWLKELVSCIQLHADVESLETCGILLTYGDYNAESDVAKDSFSTICLEQDFLAQKLDKLLHTLLGFRVPAFACLKNYISTMSM